MRISKRRGGDCLWVGVLVALSSVCVASGGIETFEGTGLGSSTWAASGVFTGNYDLVWSFAQARASSVYSGDPAISLRSSSSEAKGWLRSDTLTGGVVRVSAAFRQALSGNFDFEIWVDDFKVGNYVSTGDTGRVDVVSFEVAQPVSRLPLTNEFTLTISNRLSTGAVAIDNLEWTPFRLFVRLDRTGTNTVFSGAQFDVEAEVFDLGQAWTGAWSVPSGFAGSVSDTNGPSLSLVPDEDDIGKTFELSYSARETEGEGAVHEGRCWIEVVAAPNPRFVDFEGTSFSYNTDTGVEIDLNGMNWRFLNVRTSLSDDRRIDATSARFRHYTALPASMESLGSFEGIGTISLHFAYYGDDRVVWFAVQTRTGEEPEWTTLPDGVFNVQGHDDITNSVFAVDVKRQDALYVRLITTGNAEQIANIDNIHIRAYGDTLPFLDRTGESQVLVGRESVIDFSVRNRDGVEREWQYSLVPDNPNASFEITAQDQLRFRFAPQSTNEWGDYTLGVTATIEDEWTRSTTMALRVVSPPSFTLLPLATNLVIPDIVDIAVSGVSLHGDGVDWTTVWTVDPLFHNAPSVNHRSRYRIAAGTTDEDVGPHLVLAVLTDLGTGVKVTNTVLLTVSMPGGGSITNEVYRIVEYPRADRLSVNGRTNRVYQAFGITNLAMGTAESAWAWQGAPITNHHGGEVVLDLPGPTGERVLFYGIRVREAP